MKAGGRFMSRETLKYLYDVRMAAELLQDFVRGKSFSDYQQNRLLSSAVERQFEIVGEALNQLRRIDAESVDKITGWQQAISFRNVLIHGYAEIDDEVVWRALKDDLPKLHKDVVSLLARS